MHKSKYKKPVYAIEKDSDDSDDSDSEDKKKLWCVCRSSDSTGFMIACDYCEEWYHGRCINLTSNTANAIKKYFCASCQKKDPSLNIVYKTGISINKPKEKLKEKINKIIKVEPTEKQLQQPNILKLDVKEFPVASYQDFSPYNCRECSGCIRNVNCNNCQNCISKSNLNCLKRICQNVQGPIPENILPKVHDKKVLCTLPKDFIPIKVMSNKKLPVINKQQLQQGNLTSSSSNASSDLTTRPIKRKVSPSTCSDNESVVSRKKSYQVPPMKKSKFNEQHHDVKQDSKPLLLKSKKENIIIKSETENIKIQQTNKQMSSSSSSDNESIYSLPMKKNLNVSRKETDEHTRRNKEHNLSKFNGNPNTLKSKNESNCLKSDHSKYLFKEETESQYPKEIREGNSVKPKEEQLFVNKKKYAVYTKQEIHKSPLEEQNLRKYNKSTNQPNLLSSSSTSSSEFVGQQIKNELLSTSSDNESLVSILKEKSYQVPQMKTSKLIEQQRGVKQNTKPLLLKSIKENIIKLESIKIPQTMSSSSDNESIVSISKENSYQVPQMKTSKLIEQQRCVKQNTKPLLLKSIKENIIKSKPESIQIAQTKYTRQMSMSSSSDNESIDAFSMKKSRNVPRKEINEHIRKNEEHNLLIFNKNPKTLKSKNESNFLKSDLSKYPFKEEAESQYPPEIRERNFVKSKEEKLFVNKKNYAMQPKKESHKSPLEDQNLGKYKKSTNQFNLSSSSSTSSNDFVNRKIKRQISFSSSSDNESVASISKKKSYLVPPTKKFKFNEPLHRKQDKKPLLLKSFKDDNVPNIELVNFVKQERTIKPINSKVKKNSSNEQLKKSGEYRDSEEVKVEHRPKHLIHKHLLQIATKKENHNNMHFKKSEKDERYTMELEQKLQAKKPEKDMNSMKPKNQIKSDIDRHSSKVGNGNKLENNINSTQQLIKPQKLNPKSEQFIEKPEKKQNLEISPKETQSIKVEKEMKPIKAREKVHPMRNEKGRHYEESSESDSEEDDNEDEESSLSEKSNDSESSSSILSETLSKYTQPKEIKAEIKPTRGRPVSNKNKVLPINNKKVTEKSTARKAESEPIKNFKSFDCYNAECNSPSRVGSKYCSNECGVKMAEQRLLKYLPERIQNWKSSVSVSDEKDKRKQFDINQEIKNIHYNLDILDTSHQDLTDFIERWRSSSIAITSNKSFMSEENVQCVTCGVMLNTVKALTHMENCFQKIEGNTMVFADFEEQPIGTKLFCDHYDININGYCKRLAALCDHTNDPKVDSKAICAFPLSVNQNSDKVCMTAKIKCHSHINWERIQRAVIDINRYRLLLRYEELGLEERKLKTNMSQRGDVISLLTHKTIDHQPWKTMLPDIHYSNQESKLKNFTKAVCIVFQ